MKLILKENPDKELTVTVEYPNQSNQVLRIINKLKAEEKFLLGSESGRNYKVLIPEIYYIEGELLLPPQNIVISHEQNSAHLVFMRFCEAWQTSLSL